MHTLKQRSLDLACLLIGAGLYCLVTWRWNVALAAWVAPVFLMRFYRRQTRWYATLPALVLLWAASFINKTGAWGMEKWLELLVSLIAALPLILALSLDRFTSRRLRGVWQTLLFPAAFVALDYGVSLLPLGLGTVLTLAPSQFYQGALFQVASLAGIWSVEFLVLWAAPVIQQVWENGFQSASARGPVLVYGICLIAALLYGSLRLVIERPQSPTVKVAGVTVAHPRNYWDVLLDHGTPKDQTQALRPEFQRIEDQLFARSEQAARGGAQVIFWSEGDAFILPERKAAFFERAAAFARQHQVYLMPAYLLLRYGDTSGFNGLSMITPQGEIAYDYEKTKSWYATTSDGHLHAVDTPYGRIGAVVCFDLDFPALIRQASAQHMDILLVPAFDTYLTRLYHTEVGLPRSVENGFSMVRMVNEGTSMAVDYRGHVLASQDFFSTPMPVMYADLPTRGVATLDGTLGDGFAWVCVFLTVAGFLVAYRLGRAAPARAAIGL